MFALSLYDYLETPNSLLGVKRRRRGDDNPKLFGFTDGGEC